MKNLATLPVVTMDAGKVLHTINIGARSQVAIFEDRVKQLGKELGYSWSLLTVDNKNVMIEDASGKYYQGDIVNLGKSQIKITNLREIKIVESKKENSFRKNLFDLIEHISKDNIQEADETFDKITRQRFRASVVPESGYVTTRDGITRKIHVSDRIVTEINKKGLIKAIAEAISGPIKINRGRIVEATFRNKSIKIPISELMRRKVVAGSIKNVAMKAYLSEGFQKRILHIATMVTEGKLQEAVDNLSKFLAEEQEFCLLTLAESQELCSNALSANCCFNKQIASDVGKIFYVTNCRINKSTMIDEWRKTARTTENALFVENVRKLQDSKTFAKDYSSFLDSVFAESSRDLGLEAAEHLITLRAIRDILTSSPEHTGELQHVENYIRELEVSRDNVDDATVMEVREFLSGLSEEVIDAAAAMDGYSNPNISTFDAATVSTSSADAKQFGDADLGNIGGALPFGEEPGGMEAGPEAGEEAGAEGGLGDLFGGAPEEGEEGGEEDILGGLGESKERKEKCKKCGKQKCECEVCEESNDFVERMKAAKAAKAAGKKAPDDKDDDKKDGEDKEASEKEIEEVIYKCDAHQLLAELNAWRKDTDKYIKEDGLKHALTTFKVSMKHAKTLGQPKIANAFRQLYIENAPVNINFKKTNGDQYNYDINEDHETWANKVRESEDGVKTDGKPKQDEAMAVVPKGEKEPKDINIAKNAGHKEAILKSGGKTPDCVTCKECKTEVKITDCLKEETAVCPECGADLFEDIMKKLNIIEASKVRMEQPGTGVQKKSVGKISTGDGKKDGMDGQEGTGVQSKKVGKISTGDGKKDGMDSLGGKGVVKGSPKETADGTAEGHIKGPNRKKYVWPGKGPETCDEEIDKIAAAISEAMDSDLEDDDIATGPEDIADIDIETGPALGDDELPPAAEPPSDEVDLSDEGGDLDIDMDIPAPSDEAPIADTGTQEVVVEPGTTEVIIKLPGGDETGEVDIGPTPDEEIIPPPSDELGEPLGGEPPALDTEELPPLPGEEEGLDEIEVEDEVMEDNNITAPSSKEYSDKKAAEADGDGKKINPDKKTKIANKDYDGTGKFKSAKK